MSDELKEYAAMSVISRITSKMTPDNLRGAVEALSKMAIAKYYIEDKEQEAKAFQIASLALLMEAEKRGMNFRIVSEDDVWLYEFLDTEDAL